LNQSSSIFCYIADGYVGTATATLLLLGTGLSGMAAWCRK